MKRPKPRKPKLTPAQFSQTMRDPNGVEVMVHGNDRGPAERRQHDDLAPITTIEGKRQVRAVQVADTIGRMVQSGAITASQAGAARRFHADFRQAQLDQLRAAPLQRQSRGLRDDTAQLAARDRIDKVIRRLGGHGSIAAHAIWFVAGAGFTIKGWAQRERNGAGRPLNEHLAKGILIGALAVLADQD